MPLKIAMSLEGTVSGPLVDWGRMQIPRSGWAGRLGDGEETDEVGKVVIRNSLEGGRIARRYGQQPVRRLKESSNTLVGAG